jgi:inner membrane protein
MPSIMSHAMVPLAMGLAMGRTRIAIPVILTGMMLSMLPDADVISFKLGIAYADQFGHRGASHSLAVAALFAAIATLLFKPARLGLTFLFLFVSAASHGLLDTLTNGGLGAALFWPLNDARFHAPITPIRVSPIGLSNFLSARGLAVLASEARWIWLPCAALSLLAIGTRRGISRHKSKGSSL